MANLLPTKSSLFILKILYVHQYFRTPEQGGAIRSYYLATGLAQAGFDVTVLTTHAETIPKTTFLNGFKVEYLPISYSHYYPKWKRIQSFLRFMWAAFRYMQTAQYDICYATSTPLTVGFLAFINRYLKHKKYIFEVRDLWPLAPVQLGFIRNKWLIRFLFWAEKKIYQNATHIVSLSPQMTDYIKTLVQKPTTTLPNISDTDFFEPTFKTICKEQPIVVAYTGTLGVANELEKLIKLAHYCQKTQQNLQFRIAGEGTELPKIKALAQHYGLNNVSFLGFLDKKGVKQLLQQAHFAYVSFADAPVLQTGSPNKFFDALAAGVPILINIKGWMTELIEKEKCGFYVAAPTPERLKSILENFYNNAALYEIYSKNARKLAENQFSKTKAVEQMVKIFKVIS